MKTIGFVGPVATRSGYGAHARDILASLIKMNKYNIQVISLPWGSTPMDALENDAPLSKEIKSRTVSQFNAQPDIFIQVSIPNEFQKVGKFNIGITAGIETTMCAPQWIEGCNRMDLIIATSEHSKKVFEDMSYDQMDKNTNQKIGELRLTTPVEVLLEGSDLSTYFKMETGLGNKNITDTLSAVKEDFAFLFVGHWLRGALGQDRKDVGMLIKSFSESFKGDENKPALILKTSSANFSIKERESFRKRIESLVSNIPNPPSVYLLFGELTNKEMNQLYNHPKIKTMVTFTKGEGFGRPLLEFTMTGKPVIASNWSGHIDFLPMNKSILLSGSLTDVHESAVDNFILKEGKWFTVNYDDAIRVLKIVRDNYDTHYKNSQELMLENREKYSLNGMINSFKKILQPVFDKPTQHKLILPKLTKIK